MKVYGFTGKTGAGKSTAVKLLENYGFYVIDADKIGHSIYLKGKKAYYEIISFFGSDVLDENSEINRKKLGKLVFSDPYKLNKLNEITHPEILNEIKEILNFLKTKKIQNVIIDAALLVEAGIHFICDETVLFMADEETLCKRITKRDGLSEDDALLRIRSRKSNEELKKSADFVIENNGDLNEFTLKIKAHFNL